MPIVLQAQMSKDDRATCWSITINNPTESDLKPSFPNNKWLMTGQMEKGKDGTDHYQGMLTTPQVRFSQVKKALPRAHIEVAKNRTALQKYVNKEDTRVAVVQNISNNIPTLFDYQHTIASKWDDNEFTEYQERYSDEELVKLGIGEIALRYVDTIVEKDIENGMCGVEYIAINPMWRSAWKRFYKSMVARERSAKLNSIVEYNDATSVPSLQEQSDCLYQEDVQEEEV